MENFERIETIDEIINEFGETVSGEADIVEEPESFPTKNRTKASVRRKKTYFKGKNRYDRICRKGFVPYRNKESVIRGMFRKTNVVRVYCSSGDTRQKGFNHSNIRRPCSAFDKMTEYYEEAV